MIKSEVIGDDVAPLPAALGYQRARQFFPSRAARVAQLNDVPHLNIWLGRFPHDRVLRPHMGLQFVR